MIFQLPPAPSKGGQSRKVRVMGAVGAMGAVRVMGVVGAVGVVGATDDDLMI
jgi:hypothetical protein